MPPYISDLSRSKALSSRALALAEALQDRESTFEAMRARLFSLSGPDDIGAQAQDEAQGQRAVDYHCVEAHAPYSYF